MRDLKYWAENSHQTHIPTAYQWHRRRLPLQVCCCLCYLLLADGRCWFNADVTNLSSAYRSSWSEPDLMKFFWVLGTTGLCCPMLDGIGNIYKESFVLEDATGIVWSNIVNGLIDMSSCLMWTSSLHQCRVISSWCIISPTALPFRPLRSPRDWVL